MVSFRTWRAIIFFGLASVGPIVMPQVAMAQAPSQSGASVVADIAPPNSIAVPRGNPAVWVQTDDYPPAAYREERGGKVVTELQIFQDGRVTDCKILESSGSVDLDDRTCQLIKRRARYRPATDAQGRFIVSSDTRAISWIAPNLTDAEKLDLNTRAAQQGDSSAMLQLGLIYEGGKGVQADDNVAAEWYKKSGQAGKSTGYYYLGNMYLWGKGVSKSEEIAKQYYKLASQMGEKLAQKALFDLSPEGKRKAAAQAMRDAAEAAKRPRGYFVGCVGDGDTKRYNVHSVNCNNPNDVLNGFRWAIAKLSSDRSTEAWNSKIVARQCAEAMDRYYNLPQSLLTSRQMIFGTIGICNLGLERLQGPSAAQASGRRR